VLVTHRDCGFYGKRLNLFGSAIEEQQRRDLATAARRIRGLAPHLEMDAYIGRQFPGRITYEIHEHNRRAGNDLMLGPALMGIRS
jgi:hypothetical protein